MVVPASSPELRERGQQDDCQFKVSLGYLVRPYLKKGGVGAFPNWLQLWPVSFHSEFLSEACLTYGIHPIPGQNPTS